MPLFTVIIPTYNRRERLLRAVESVLAQTCADHEIIVVDDGSSDGTGAALARFGGRVRLLCQENRGPAAARNAGAYATSGEYLAFLDSDDWWLPWTLDHYAALVEEHQRPSWLYGRGFVGVRAAGVSARTPLVARRFTTYLEAASLDGLIPLPTGVAIRRDVFLRAGGFSDTIRNAEDVDLWFRLAEEPGFVLMDAPVTAVRELHAGNHGEDVVSSFEGMMALVARERGGLYPGGAAAASLRRGIITRQLMYYAQHYSRRGRRDLALQLYGMVLRFQLEGGFREAPFGGKSNRFLATFPLFLASPRAYGRLKDGVTAYRSSEPDTRAGGR